jgi:membrane-associated protease RseP (regulator of RpoE activity)
MVDLLQVVLVAGLVYTLAGMFAQSRGLLPGWVRVQGPITTLHTEYGKAFLDWLATPRRLWRAWGNFGVGIALVVMVGSFALVLVAGLQAVVDPTPTALNRPRNALAIPGVNQFLPLTVAGEIIAGLLVGLVVHEGGHGLLCRVEDIDIESMGLALLAFIPLGAFVEPDEESRDRADRGAQTRMFAAGVTNNFAVAVVAFALLFGPVSGAIAVVDGVPVGGTIEGSPAAQAGIGGGDVVTGVEGEPVANASDLDATLAELDDGTVRVERRNAPDVEVERTVLVTAAVRDAQVSVNTTITAVNGTAVHTESGFRQAVENRSVARLTTEDGNVTAPMGAYVVVLEGEPLDEAGAPAGDPMIITAIDGQRVLEASDVSAALSDTGPGDEVTVVGYVGGERDTFEATLRSSDDGSGFLGVAPQPGISGFEVDDFGIDAYPAEGFLGVLQGGGPGGSFVARVFFALTLPFASVSVPGLSYNFAGFVAPFTGFYTVQGPLAVLGAGAVFLLANLLFWTAWINLIIGQFNCIPTYPLDGGHILRTSAETVVSRLPVEDGHGIARGVTFTVSLVMVAALLLMIFGPRLLT